MKYKGGVMGIRDSKLGPPSAAVVALRNQYDELSFADRFQFRRELSDDEIDDQTVVHGMLVGSMDPEHAIVRDIPINEWLLISEYGLNEIQTLKIAARWIDLRTKVQAVTFNTNFACVCLSLPDNPEVTLNNIQGISKDQQKKLLGGYVEHNGQVYGLTNFLKILSLSATHGTPYNEWIEGQLENSEEEDDDEPEPRGFKYRQALERPELTLAEYNAEKQQEKTDSICLENEKWRTFFSSL